MTHCTTAHNPIIEATLIAIILIAFIGLVTWIFHIETQGKQLTLLGRILSKTGKTYLKIGTIIHKTVQNLTIQPEDD